MRVLIAANVTEGSGGVAHHIAELSSALANLGVEVEHHWQDKEGGRRLGGWSASRFSASVARRVRAHRPDVLHTHGSDGAIANRVAPQHTARVVTSHGDERSSWRVEMAHTAVTGERPPLLTRVAVPLTVLPLFAAAIRSADAVIALHEGDAEDYRRERSASQSSVVAIPNGCSPPPHGSVPVPGRVVFVGGWFWRKGADVLPAAFRHVRVAHPGATLELLGPGKDSPGRFAPEDQAHVSAEGWVDRREVWEAMSRADVLVAPSRFEGMPLAVLEALASGVPVVASDLPGHRNSVGDAGMLVDADDPHAIGQAIVSIIRDRTLRAQMSRAGELWARQHSWAQVAQATVEVYKEAVRVRRTPGSIMLA